MVLKKNKNIFIAESQSLNVDETVRSGILRIIGISGDFQDPIEQLERENLIWYFIRPLCKYKDITEQINLTTEQTTTKDFNYRTKHCTENELGKNKYLFK